MKKFRELAKRFVKGFAITVCIVSFALPVSACSPDRDEKTVVTIVNRRGLDHLEALIESTYRDIDFQCEVNVSSSVVDYRLKAGKGPDLVVVSQPADQESVQYVYPLGGQTFSTAYENSIMKSMSIDDVFYYLPLPGQYWGYVVNKSLFDSQKLALPETNEQLISGLLELQSNDLGVTEDRYAFNYEGLDNVSVGNFLVACMVPEFLGKASGILWMEDFYQEKATFAGSEWEHSFDLSQRLIDEGLLKKELFNKNTNAPTFVPELAKGDLAIVYGDSALLAETTAANKKLSEEGAAEEYEYVMLPFLPDTDPEEKSWTIAAPTSYIGINNRLTEAGCEDKLNACKRIMDLISTEAGQRALMQDTNTAISYLKNGVTGRAEIPKGLETAVASGYVYNVKFPGRIVEYLGEQGCSVLTEAKTKTEGLQAVDQYYQSGLSEASYDMTPVGTLAADLVESDYSVRRRETALGDLVADSIAERAGTQIAVANGGGIRASLYAGEVVAGDLKVVCPYDNKIIVVDMTGATLWEMLENSVSVLTGSEIPGGRFLQVSGLKYVFDSGRPVGQRIESVSLADGTKIEAGSVYRVAINDYMAGVRGYLNGNGDGYLMLNLYSDTHPPASGAALVAETEYTYRDALKYYFGSRGGAAIEKKVEGRIVDLGA